MELEASKSIDGLIHRADGVYFSDGTKVHGINNMLQLDADVPNDFQISEWQNLAENEQGQKEVAEARKQAEINENVRKMKATQEHQKEVSIGQAMMQIEQKNSLKNKVGIDGLVHYQDGTSSFPDGSPVSGANLFLQLNDSDPLVNNVEPTFEEMEAHKDELAQAKADSIKYQQTMAQTQEKARVAAEYESHFNTVDGLWHNADGTQQFSQGGEAVKGPNVWRS